MGTAYMPQAKSIEWETPQHLFDEWDKEFDFTLDPCATHLNAKCPNYFTRDENGLVRSWKGHKVFMNPPYGKELAKWIKKAYDERDFSDVIVALLPARTGNKWFHEWVYHHAEIRFLKGRIRFSGKDAAPFDSMLVIWRGEAV